MHLPIPCRSQYPVWCVRYGYHEARRLKEVSGLPGRLRPVRFDRVVLTLQLLVAGLSYICIMTVHAMNSARWIIRILLEPEVCDSASRPQHVGNGNLRFPMFRIDLTVFDGSLLSSGHHKYAA